MTVRTKVCSNCLQEKGISSFSARVGAPDGLKGTCKECIAEKKRIRIAGNPELAERLRAENRAFYKAKGPYVEKHNRKRKERYWRDDDFREAVQARQKIINKRLWENEEYRNKVLGRHRDQYANDPVFAEACKRRWMKSRFLRRENEEFDAFMARMEQEQDDWEANQAEQITTEGDENV